MCPACQVRLRHVDSAIPSGGCAQGRAKFRADQVFLPVVELGLVEQPEADRRPCRSRVRSAPEAARPAPAL